MGPSRPLVKLDHNNIFQSGSDDISIPDHLDAASFVFDYEPSGDSNVPARTIDCKQDFLIDGLTGRRLTFEEAKGLTAQTARALEKYLDLGWDDILAIFSPNDLLYPIALWGAHRLGAIVSSANPSYSSSELAYQLRVLTEYKSLKGIVVHPDSLDIAIQAADSVGLSRDRIILIKPAKNGTSTANQYPTLEDIASRESSKEREWKKLGPKEARRKLAFLNFSSGTTGLPKAVAIAHYSVAANVLQMIKHREGCNWIQYEDKALAVLPFYHIYGKIVVLHHMVYRGQPLVILPRFVLKDFLDVTVSYKITIHYIVPPIAVLLVKSPLAAKYDLDHIKYAMCGAAPLTKEVSDALCRRVRSVELCQAYGLTETSTTVTMCPVPTPDRRIQFGSIGSILCNIQIKIVDPMTGRNLGFDERGELCCRSPANALCYINNEKATKETFDEEGYIHTGDEAYINRDGFVYITDRLKELIKTKGNQVAPAEIEGHLIGHQDVSDACVIGVPDDYAGELPRAFIVLSEYAATRAKSSVAAASEIKSSIYKHVSDHKVRYKWLDGGIEFVPAIPKNPSGKLLRRKIRDLYAKRTQKVKSLL